MCNIFIHRLIYKNKSKKNNISKQVLTGNLNYDEINDCINRSINILSLNEYLKKYLFYVNEKIKHGDNKYFFNVSSVYNDLMLDYQSTKHFYGIIKPDLIGNYRYILNIKIMTITLNEFKTTNPQLKLNNDFTNILYNLSEINQSLNLIINKTINKKSFAKFNNFMILQQLDHHLLIQSLYDLNNLTSNLNEFVLTLRSLLKTDNELSVKFNETIQVLNQSLKEFIFIHNY